MSTEEASVLAHSQLPVIQRPIDNTALQAYMACPREFFFAMYLHRRAKDQEKKAALGFGSAWHTALEMHYKSNGNRDVVMLALQAKHGDLYPEGDYRTVNRVMIDYDKYVKEYGLPQQEEAKTVGWPEAPLVEIATNAQGSGLIHPWAGKLDRVIKVGNFYYIEDHKTTSRLDKHYFGQFVLSYQMKGYTFLGKQLLPSLNIIGVRINLSHVLTGKTEFHRQVFTYSDATLAEWVRVTNSWMRRLGRDIEMYLECLDKGMDAFEAMLDAFPAHWGDNGCSRKFGRCTYHEVCEAGPSIRQAMLERDFEVKPWNPLEVDDE